MPQAFYLKLCDHSKEKRREEKREKQKCKKAFGIFVCVLCTIALQSTVTFCRWGKNTRFRGQNFALVQARHSSNNISYFATKAFSGTKNITRDRNALKQRCNGSRDTSWKSLFLTSVMICIGRVFLVSLVQCQTLVFGFVVRRAQKQTRVLFRLLLKEFIWHE